MFRFAILIAASLAGATWAAAETVDVKYYGKLDLAPFACTDVSRSSFIICALRSAGMTSLRGSASVLGRRLVQHDRAG